MGAATARRRLFLARHPWCIFCGGSQPATTVEHCPPRALFQRRTWPEGFEFPACDKCNRGSSADDLIVALLGRMDPFTSKGDQDGAVRGYVARLDRSYPGLLGRMIPSPREARERNRELGIAPGPGLTHQQAGVLKLPHEVRHAVSVFSRKLAKAIFYADAQRPFPNSGSLFLNWFTNVDLFRENRYLAMEGLKDIHGSVLKISRATKALNDQFACKLSIDDGKEFFLLQSLFGKAFGVVIFGNVHEGRLEKDFIEIRGTDTSNGSITVLQSKALADFEKDPSQLLRE